jgi:hypothetical protein
VFADVTFFKFQSFFLIFLLHFRFSLLLCSLISTLGIYTMSEIDHSIHATTSIFFVCEFCSDTSSGPSYLLLYKKILDPMTLIIPFLTMFLIMLYLLCIPVLLPISPLHIFLCVLKMLYLMMDGERLCMIV